MLSNYTKPSIIWTDVEDRIDATFYRTDFVLSLDQIFNNLTIPVLPNRQLIHELTDYTANGSFESLKNNVSYTDHTGIPMIRGKNFKNGVLDKTDLNYITHETYRFLKKSELNVGNLLFTKTGTLGNTIVWSEYFGKATLGDNIFKVRYKNGVNPYYIHAYFSTDYGNKWVERYAQGGVQPTIIKESFREIKIPVPDIPIQDYIGNKIKKAENLREEARKLNEECRNEFNKELDLKVDFNKSNFVVGMEGYKTISSKPSIIYTTENYEMKIAPQYYHPRRVYLLEQLKQLKFNTKKLAELSNRISSKSRVNKFLYVGPDCIDNTFGYITPVPVNVTTNTVKAQKDDILFCRLRPNLNNVTICDMENIQASAEFLQYRVRDDFKYLYYLFFVLRHPYTLYQIVDTAIGDRPRVDEELVDDILIPIISEETMAKIDENIKKALFNIRLANELTFEAQRDVESLIEGTFDESKIVEVK